MASSFILSLSLHVESEAHDVAVLHHVVLAFDAELAGLAHGGFGAVLDVVVVLDDLGADEALLEVGVDDAGTLRSLPAFVVGPGLDFHLAGGDERLEVEQAVDGLDEAVAAAVPQAEVFEEHLLLLVGFQFGDVGLGLGGDRSISWASSPLMASRTCST